MSFPDVYRVVTGHDENGKAVILENGPLKTVMDLEAVLGTRFHELWSTTTTPAQVTHSQIDPTLGPVVLLPPDTQKFLQHGDSKMAEMFSKVGDEKAYTVKPNSPHPLMHRTQSIDYGIVIEGELPLIVEDGNALLKPGSVVIQRGKKPCMGKPPRQNVSHSLCAY